MIKSLSAVVVFVLLSVAALVLPGFVPKVEAGETVAETVAMSKADRLDVRPASANCTDEVWPNITAPCLRNSEAHRLVQEARLVTARR